MGHLHYTLLLIVILFGLSGFASAKPRNPFLVRVCQDTLHCLKSSINECHLSDREYKELSEWYVKNCISRRIIFRKSAAKSTFDQPDG